MPLLYRKMAILAKLETTYGTDAVPTGAANAILARNVKVTPATVESESRDLARPYLGNSEEILGAFYGSMSFDVEIAGAGAAGTVPKYGPLLRACGMAEVVVAATSVKYKPISTSFEALSMRFYLDGVLHNMTGARGSVALKYSNRSAPLYTFTFSGLFKPVVDAGLPSVDYTGFVKPLAMNTANTPTWEIHGLTTSVLRSISFDLANQVSYRNLVNSEAVQILDRKPVGQIELEATLMATKNWFAAAVASDTGASKLVHGTVAGNIVEINTPALQLVDPNYSDFEGGAMLTSRTKLMPTTAGNDEIEIVVR